MAERLTGFRKFLICYVVPWCSFAPGFAIGYVLHGWQLGGIFGMICMSLAHNWATRKYYGITDDWAKPLAERRRSQQSEP